MAKQSCMEFAWVIKNFSSLQSEKCYSVPFMIGDCKWRLCAYPKGNRNVDYLSLYLEAADYESLPSGWRRYVNLRLTIVKQAHEIYPIWKGTQCWFDKVSWNWGFTSMIPLTKLHDKDEGFLVNGEVKIIVKVEVLDVIGTLDESEKSNEASRPHKKMKPNDDCAKSNVLLKEASSVKESIVLNGFQVLPSQVDSVTRVFERHPEIAVNFRAKNQHLRTTCMNFLISIIETLCKSLQELTNEDLVDADIALTYLKDVRFKVDWLEKKLDDVKEKKKKEQSDLAELQETEEKSLKLKADLLATRTLLSFDDVV